MPLHILRFLGLGLSIVGVSSAIAASVPKTEPTGVFMKGANLEWSSAHADSKVSGEDHRAYHKSGEAERVLWLKEHAADVGTQAYKDANRKFLQKRNLMHRQWHLEKSGWVHSNDASMKFFDAELTITIVNPPADTIGRTYTGIPMSRRSLVNQTIRNQKVHSLTVGQ